MGRANRGGTHTGQTPLQRGSDDNDYGDEGDDDDDVSASSLDGTLTRVTGLSFNRVPFNEQFLTLIPIGAVDLQDLDRRGT